MPSKPGRNDPCPCNSGLKYKKCCLARDEEAARAEALARPREPLSAPSRRRSDGPGFGDALGEYARPLLDLAGSDMERINKAMAMSMLCWNIALGRPEEDEDQLNESLESMPREMFPAMHRAPRD